MKVKDLKKGDLFREEDMGLYVVCRADEDARLVDKPGYHGHKCMATVISGDSPAGRIIEYFESHNAGWYGPKLSPYTPENKEAPDASITP